MSNITYSFLISGLAGLATMIGTFVIFFHIKQEQKLISYSLSFAAGVMITLSVIDLIPTSFEYIHEFYQLIPSLLMVLLFTIIGILITVSIDNIVPKQDFNSNTKLFRTGIFSMIILVLHNIPEGIATFVTSTSDLTFGITLALVITLHNIPEGISIAVPIYYSTKSKIKALFYTFIAGISELAGAFIAYIFLSPYITKVRFAFLFAIIAGMMLYISFYELFPTALGYTNRCKLIKPFLAGIVVMFSCHLIFH